MIRDCISPDNLQSYKIINTSFWW